MLAVRFHTYLLLKYGCYTNRLHAIKTRKAIAAQTKQYRAIKNFQRII